METKKEYAFKLVEKVIHGQRVQVKVYNKQEYASDAVMYCHPVKRNTKKSS